jgi:hypothetical protein
MIAPQICNSIAHTVTISAILRSGIGRATAW